MRPLKAAALMGATGTGKSALAMRLAERFDTSIVSCDSMQLYRGLDIGTAKPSREEQQRVRHYLIDCADISETWSAARWADAASDAIRSENEQGNIPIIVGGTGMYLRALLEGFADIPAEDPKVRESLLEDQKAHGTPYLHAKLLEVDPVTAARLEVNDTQRIMRALGVFHSSGRPLSHWQMQGSGPKQQIDCPVVVLEVERELLRERIAERFHAMMDAGWLAETKWLLAQVPGELHPAVRAVGYRQLIAHLKGECTLEEAVADGITATRRYAKRQQTWFRNQTPDAFFCDAGACEAALIKILER